MCEAWGGSLERRDDIIDAVVALPFIRFGGRETMTKLNINLKDKIIISWDHCYVGNKQGDGIATGRGGLRGLI